MVNNNFIDITGKIYGRWTVLRRVANKGSIICWECLCSCGNVKIVRGCHLKSGRSVSCGCFQKERASECATKHGEHGIPEYVAWKNMISRCYNPNNDSYKSYGGRGIQICNEWRNDFIIFYRDMGERPSLKHSIDRIDVNGNYEQLNCRWATGDIQAQNKRMSKRNTTGVRGVSVRNDVKRYTSSISVRNHKIHLGTFDTIEQSALVRKEAERIYW